MTVVWFSKIDPGEEARSVELDGYPHELGGCSIIFFFVVSMELLCSFPFRGHPISTRPLACLSSGPSYRLGGGGDLNALLGSNVTWQQLVGEQPLIVDTIQALLCPNLWRSDRRGLLLLLLLPSDTGSVQVGFCPADPIISGRGWLSLSAPYIVWHIYQKVWCKKPIMHAGHNIGCVRQMSFEHFLVT